MCKALDTVSCELTKKGITHKIDSNNKIYLKRKSTVPIPKDMIPKPILAALDLYSSGRLTTETLGRQRVYDLHVSLRRYMLIPPVERKPPRDWRQYHREYLKAWRRRQRPQC